MLIEHKDYDINDLTEIADVIYELAEKKYGLTLPKSNIFLVSPHQMAMEASMFGLSAPYRHWRYAVGVESAPAETGILEMIVPDDPPTAYFSNRNTLVEQAAVIAHACIGHTHFAQNNYLHVKYGNSRNRVAELKSSYEYVEILRKKFSDQTVTDFLDYLHTWEYNSMTSYEKAANEHVLESVDKYEITNASPFQTKAVNISSKQFGDRKEYNILRFILDHAPIDEEFKNIVRIVMRESQRKYPLIRTKVMNEGWASFWHRQIMHDLYDEGHASEGAMLEFYKMDGAVKYDRDGGAHDNPYLLGFKIWDKIVQVCKEPTKEDWNRYPTIAGTDWLETIKEIEANYADDTFIRQFLSTEIIQDLQLASIKYIDRNTRYIEYEVTGAQDEQVDHIRHTLANSHTIAGMGIPSIYVDMAHTVTPDRTGMHSIELKSDSAVAFDKNIRIPINNIAAIFGKGITKVKLDVEKTATNPAFTIFSS